MKKLIGLAACILLMVGNIQAHALWVATNETGVVGEAQEIKVYFGEFTYGVIEEVGGEAFEMMKNFTLSVISPAGEKTSLKVEAKDTYYLATYTPSEEGTYTVVLDNDKIKVIDYSEYDFGIFKTHYHSVAKIQVGDRGAETHTDNKAGITLKNLPSSDEKVQLQVLFKGEAMAETEVKVFLADQWSKTLKTDEDGKVAFGLPWDTDYLVEVTTEERVPGTYNGEEYEFVWHCVTQQLSK
ncbi:MAG: DUF4198 domain-containing protein [Bacteroidota bacterium]